MLDRLPVRSLSFDLKARSGVTLPGFVGPLLRGALGAALARADDGAAFAALFAESRRGAADAPRPWRLLAPALRLGTTGRPEAMRLRAGDTLCFGITLFGATTADSRAIASAVELLAWRGLGPARAPFVLAEVYDVPPRGEESPALSGARFTLRVETPLRLARRRGELEKPTLGSLAAAAAERLRRLAGAAGDESAPCELPSPRVTRDAGTKAERPEPREDLARVSLGRWSSRQQRWYPLDGHVGELHAEHAPPELLGALRAAAVLGVGKGTTSGLGRVELEEAP